MSKSLALILAGVLSLAAPPAERGDYADAPSAFEHGRSDRSSVFDAPAPPPLRDTELRRLNRDLPQLWNVATAADGALFALSGVLGDGGTPAVVRLDPETLQTVWRTPLPQPDGAVKWNYPGAVAVHANGMVYAVYMTRLVKLNPRDGRIHATLDLPAPNGVAHTTYNGFLILPDGRILAKSHHRKPACPVQGYRAFIECGVAGLPASALVLVDPDRMTPIWQGHAPELIGGRISAVSHRGRLYIYLAGENAVHRMRYRNGRLILDRRWGPVRYRSGEQTPGTAVVGFGDWVVVQNNAIPTRAPLTVMAIAQDDSRIVHSIAPFPVAADHWYFMPSKVSADWANRRVYTVAAYDGLTALDFDPRRGFRIAWRVAQPSGAFITLVGPPDGRVIVASDMTGATQDALGAPRHEREALVWRDAATGNELGRVADLPRNFGLTLTPDSTGAMLYPTRNGGLYRLIPGKRPPDARR